MCLLFFSYKNTPGCRLVAVANRDEYFERPTAPLNYLDEQKTTLGGRDLQEGGTWMGVTRQGRFGALTNFRQGGVVRNDCISRGEIVMNFLKGSYSAAEYVELLVKSRDKYNGYNLIAGDDEGIYYYSNRNGTPISLAPGFYGLSNHLIDTPWPKVVLGKQLVEPFLDREFRGSLEDCRPVFEVLQDRTQPEDHELPDTGVGLRWERLLGSIFIDSPGYGTRSSAVVVIRDDTGIVFHEQTYLRDGEQSCRSEHREISFDRC